MNSNPCVHAVAASVLHCRCCSLIVVAGVQVTPADILHTPFTSLSAFKQQQELQKQQAEGQAQAQAAAAMEVEVAGDASGSTANSDAPGAVAGGSGSTAQAAAQQQILGAVLEECLLNSRVEVGVWQLYCTVRTALAGACYLS